MQTNQSPTDTAGSVAELLREHRRTAGLTQAALAELAGLSEQAISLIERGTRRRPRRQTLDAIGKALQLDAAATAALMRAAKQQNAVRATGPPQVPQEVPSAPADFTGREEELERLLSVLSTVPETPDTVPMFAISGMGGVGKTALAARAAHLAAPSFPDGQLYIDLRGYGPGDAVEPLAAAGQLLRSLGLPSAAVPDDVDGATALLRSCLARRRVLLVLDNANSAAQVAPLLPGAPGPTVVITSRRALITLPGCSQIGLVPLPDSATVELLSTVAGAARIAVDSDDAREIARLTGNLPLAVRLVGARLAARPNWPVAYLVEQLRDERRRLDQLGSGESGVRANIAGSLEFLAASDSALDRRAAATVDYLGLLSSAELITLTAAALLDEPVHQAERSLERLVDLNLLEAVAPGRYRLHDLVLTFARERGLTKLPEPLQRAALDRLLQLYVDIAWSCQRLTHHHSRRLALAGSASDPVGFSDAGAALEWLDGQQANIIEAFGQARRTPALHGRLPELALALFGYHEARSRWPQMRSIISAAQEVTGDQHRLLAAWLQHDRAIPDVEHHDLDSGERHLLRALELFEELGDAVGQARCCSSISYVYSIQGRLDECLVWTERTLELSRTIGDPNVEGLGLLIRGTALAKQGRHDLARSSFELSVGIAEARLNQRSRAKRYGMIGHAYLAAGQVDDAATALVRGFESFAASGDENGQAEMLLRLASLELARDNESAASRYATAGLAHARAGADRHREGELLLVTGRIEYARGRLQEARGRWQEAAELLRVYAPHAEQQATDLLKLLD
ncbi:helix-turn-helix domain-containing protein [Kribbella sp. GL6]|uniref:helix-turn-helix domain-containing protein n=1 Tax=Kribbella sp. GL6 TaxID=3419765 RepID=UPI003CFC7D13